MTPTSLQKNLLKDYLRKNLSYRETCEEFYDHILTAIALSDSVETFEEQVNYVLKHDFGGPGNLRKVETSFKRNATSAYFKKYMASLGLILRLPMLLYILSFSLLIYLFRDKVEIHNQTFLWLYFAHTGLIFCYYLFRQFKIGSLTRDLKKSITDTAFSRLLHFPIRIFMASILLYNLRNLAGISTFKMLYFPDYSSGPALTIILTIYLVHSLAILKILKDEFKEVTVQE